MIARERQKNSFESLCPSLLRTWDDVRKAILESGRQF